MSTEFDKHTIPDFGRKLAHVEGIMGAYLPRYGFDYRLFLLPFNDFCDALRTAGLAVMGRWLMRHLREMLRESVPQGERIIIRTDGRLNVGGIGQSDDGIRLPRLTPKQVTRLVDLLRHLPAEHRAGVCVYFGEYLLQ